MMMALPFVRSGFALTSEEYVRWLVDIGGELSSEDCPRIESVRAVFERVRAAADKRANRPPKLLLIRETDDPWIMCLKDGTVVLTMKGIEICYSSGSESEGDDRLAFIIGHELAHLAKDDFWDMAAFETLQKVDKSQKLAIRELLGLFGRKSPGDESEAGKKRKQQEVEADSYGLIYAVMAGFNPGTIVNESGKNFLRYWADQITGKEAYSDAEHPHVDTRAAFLLSHMSSVKDDLDLFHLGVRLYQVGKYEAALAFLEEFQKKFPSREVSNNIGLVYYQLAVRELARYDRKRVCRDHLATIMDTETRGNVFRKQGAEKKFEEYIQEAVRHFRIACDKDPFYVPARVNLSSAHMLSNDYTKALEPAEEAVRIQGNSPQARNNHILAMYRFQNAHKTDYTEQTVRDLKSLTEGHPGYAAPVYNLARVLYEKNRKSEANAAWQAFLDMESRGDYAHCSEEMLGIKISRGKRASENMPVREPAVKPDMLYSDIKDHLAGFEIWNRRVKGVLYMFCHRDDLSVLLVDDVVKVVEQVVARKTGVSDFRGRQPRRILNNCSGATTFVYDKFAIDIRAETVTRVIYF